MRGAAVALIVATLLCGCQERSSDTHLRGQQSPAVDRVPDDPWAASMEAAAARLAERLDRWSSADQAACRRQCVRETPEVAMVAFRHALLADRVKTAEALADAWQGAFGETALIEAVAAYRRDPRRVRETLSALDAIRRFVRTCQANEAAAALERLAADAPAVLWSAEADLLRARVRCLAEQQGDEPSFANAAPTALIGAERDSLRLIHRYRAADTDNRRDALATELVEGARAVNGLQLAADLESMLPVGSQVTGGRGAAAWCGYLARGCLAAGMPELALRYAGRWQAQVETLGEASMRNELMRVLSAAHAALGRNDIALHHAMAAVEQSDGLPPRGRAAAADQLGCVLASMGRHEQAAAIFLHGLDWGGDELAAAQGADLALNAAAELIRSGSLDKAQGMLNRARVEPNDAGAAPRTLRSEALELILRCVRGDADRTVDEARGLLAVAQSQGDWRFLEQYGGLPDRAARATRTARQHTLPERPEDYGAAKPREVLKGMFNEGGQ